MPINHKPIREIVEVAWAG